MAYRTGRTRTLTWQFRLQGVTTLSFDNRRFPIEEPDAPAMPSCTGRVAATAGGMAVDAIAYAEEIVEVDEHGNPIGRLAGDPYEVKVGFKVTASGYDFPSEIGYLYDTLEVAEDAKVTLSKSLDITATLSVETEEVLEIESLGGAGWYNMVADAPQSQRAKFRLGRFGGSYSLSAGPVSFAGDLPNDGGEITHYCTMSAECGPSESPYFVYGGCGGGASGPYSVDLLAQPCDYSYTNHILTHTIDGATTTANTPAAVSVSSTGYQRATGQAGAALHGDKTYSVSGVIRAMEQASPDAMTVSISGHTPSAVEASGGSFSASGVQKQYQVGLQAQMVNWSDSAGEGVPIGCSLSSADLTANGDDPRCIRLPLRGKVFAGMTLSLASSFQIAKGDGSKGTWGGAALADYDGSGYARIPGGRGTVSFVPAVSALTYRYLRLRVRSVGSDNVPLTVTIPACSVEIDNTEFGGGSITREDVYSGEETPDKSWSSGLATGADGVWTDIDIDLCAPHNVSAATDAQDTRWPLPTRMPRYFGVWRIEDIHIDVPSGKAVEIDTISYVRGDASGGAFADWVPTWYTNQGTVSGGAYTLTGDWPQQTRPKEILDADTELTYFARRFLLGRVDGRQTAEEPDLAYTRMVTEEVETTAFAVQSIEGLADRLNGSDAHSSGSILRYPGLTATIDAPAVPSGTPTIYPPVEDWYLNRSLPATFIAGQGCLYAGAATGWQYGWDRPFGASVSAQPLYDEVEWYPACGDAFNHAGEDYADGAIVLVAAQTLRASGHGLANGQDHQPRYEDTVEAQEGGGARGSGATDADGYYQTSGNGELHGAGANATAQLYHATSGNSVTRDFYPRRRGRATFRVFVAAKPTALVYDRARGILCVALDDATIKALDAGTHEAVAQSAPYAGVERFRRLAVDSRRGLLVGVAEGTGGYEVGGWAVISSSDFGRTGSNLLTFDSSTTSVGVVEDTQRGVFLLVETVAHDTNLVYTDLSDPDDYVLQPNVAAQTPHGDVRDLAYNAATGRIMGLFEPSGGAIQQWYTDDLGRTWTQLA